MLIKELVLDNSIIMNYDDLPCNPVYCLPDAYGLCDPDMDENGGCDPHYDND